MSNRDQALELISTLDGVYSELRREFQGMPGPIGEAARDLINIVSMTRMTLHADAHDDEDAMPDSGLVEQTFVRAAEFCRGSLQSAPRGDRVRINQVTAARAAIAFNEGVKP